MSSFLWIEPQGVGQRPAKRMEWISDLKFEISNSRRAIMANVSADMVMIRPVGSKLKTLISTLISANLR
jgi:hypothetical protein